MICTIPGLGERTLNRYDYDFNKTNKPLQNHLHGENVLSVPLDHSSHPIYRVSLCFEHGFQGCYLYRMYEYCIFIARGFSIFLLNIVKHHPKCWGE